MSRRISFAVIWSMAAMGVFGLVTTVAGLELDWPRGLIVLAAIVAVAYGVARIQLPARR